MVLVGWGGEGGFRGGWGSGDQGFGDRVRGSRGASGFQGLGPSGAKRVLGSAAKATCSAPECWGSRIFGLMGW